MFKSKKQNRLAGLGYSSLYPYTSSAFSFFPLCPQFLTNFRSSLSSLPVSQICSSAALSCPCKFPVWASLVISTRWNWPQIVTRRYEEESATPGVQHLILDMTKAAVQGVGSEMATWKFTEERQCDGYYQKRKIKKRCISIKFESHSPHL